MSEWSTLEKLKKYGWIIAVAVAVIAVIFFASCKKGDIPFTQSEYDREFRDQANGSGIPDTDTNFRHKYTTPGGIIIESVVPVPNEFLGYTDEAAQRQTERFATMFPDWTLGRELRGRKIFIINPTQGCVTEVDDPGSPCLYIQGTRAAAATFGCDDRWTDLDKNPPIVIPHQQAQNWSKVQWYQNSVEYENEHRGGWLNRHLSPQNVFYHFLGPNDVHPWTWGDAKGLTAMPKRSHEVK